MEVTQLEGGTARAVTLSFKGPKTGWVPRGPALGHMMDPRGAVGVRAHPHLTLVAAVTAALAARFRPLLPTLIMVS